MKSIYKFFSGALLRAQFAEGGYKENMEIQIKRDGIVLRGDLIKPECEKCPVVVLFHGFMSARDNDLLCEIAERCVEKGMAAVKFDFDGHGESGGDFSDMNAYTELLDASKIIDYVRGLDFVTDIYIVGHSMGGVAGGMTAGFYRDKVKKLVMLAPAGGMKRDAQLGKYFGAAYDADNIPDYFPVVNEKRGIKDKLGGFFFRVAKTLPIYEVTSQFEKDTLIIHGTEDESVSFESSKIYKEYMPHAELVLIEGENHSLNAFAREEVVKRVAEFLAR